MKFISRTEEFILLAIMDLESQAYAVKIRDFLLDAVGEDWAFGALFVMMDRLVKKGLLSSTLSDPTPQRGGRRKRIYKLTEKAFDELERIRSLQESVWSRTPLPTKNGGA
ncbi:hypothetical protein ACFLT9_10685 [Acidobacteriota bacterium]